MIGQYLILMIICLINALLKYTEEGQVILKDLGGVNGVF